MSWIVVPIQPDTNEYYKARVAHPAGYRPVGSVATGNPPTDDRFEMAYVRDASYTKLSEEWKIPIKFTAEGPPREVDYVVLHGTTEKATSRPTIQDADPGGGRGASRKIPIFKTATPGSKTLSW